MRLVIKCSLYSRVAFIYGCNSKEGEVEIIMIRGKKHSASIIFIRENSASVRGRLVFRNVYMVRTIFSTDI